MLYRFLKNYHPSVLIITLFLGILFFLKHLIFVSEINIDYSISEMPLFILIVNIFNNNKPIYLIFSIIAIIVYSYYLVKLNLNYYFVEERTYLPALFYLLFSAVIYALIGFHPILFSIIFLLIIIDKILESPKTDKLSIYYDMGLFLAIGSLFYSNLLLLLLFVILGLQAVNTLNGRKIIIILTGILTIYFFVATYYFLTDSLTQFIEILQNAWFANHEIISLNIYFKVYLAIIAILLIASLVNSYIRLNQKKIIARKYFTIFVMLLIYCLLCFFIIPGFSFAVFYIISIPLAYLFTEYFIYLKKNWIRELIFGILFFSSVLMLVLS